MKDEREERERQTDEAEETRESDAAAERLRQFERERGVEDDPASPAPRRGREDDNEEEGET